MSKITQRQALITALKARGCQQIEYPTRRYVVFSADALFTHATEQDLKLFVGTAGGLRVGKTLGRDHPVIEQLRLKLLAEGGYSR